MNNSDDQRSSPRRSTVLKGKVIFNNRSSVLDCVVRDFSETGAQISFADVSAIPQEFELEIPSRGLRLPARVIWSRGTNHGVQFIQEQGGQGANA